MLNTAHSWVNNFEPQRSARFEGMFLLMENICMGRGMSHIIDGFETMMVFIIQLYMIHLNNNDLHFDSQSNEKNGPTFLLRGSFKVGLS